MIRVAICENDKNLAAGLRNFIVTYLKSRGFYNVETSVARSYTDLGTAMSRLRTDFFNAVFCRLELAQNTGAAEGGAPAGTTEAFAQKTIDHLRELAPNTHFILMSTVPRVALVAYATSSEFMQIPIDQENLKRIIDEGMRYDAQDGVTRFAVKTSSGTANMNLEDITFVETGRKGPVIHLPADRQVVTRGSLQALFEQLNSRDDRFVRAGGSFIINLDNVRSIGDGTVVFGSGEAIILPVRARKLIQDAFASYRLRSA